MGTILENAEEPTPANYPLTFKRELAQHACDESVSVAQLALEHGLNTNMVFKCRRDLRAGRLDGATALLPVSVIPNGSQEQSKLAAEGMIEIRISA